MLKKNYLRGWLLVCLSLLSIVIIHANDKLSCKTDLFLCQYNSATVSQRQHMPAVSRAVGVDMMDCFIHVNSHDYSRLQALGVEIGSEFSTFVTARVPIGRLEQVTALDEVLWVEVSEELAADSDLAMEASHADWVHQGSDGEGHQLTSDYHGKGVLLGVIDSGFEFNHMANCQDGGMGATRIKYISYSANEVYQTSSAINAFLNSHTNDRTDSSHGQHVLGIAAGTLIDGYGGTADQADIALGVGNTSTNIVSNIQNIARFAHDNNQPCVISMSLGRLLGGHDGTNELARAIDEVVQQYGILYTISCGNYGSYNTSIAKTFTTSSTSVSTLVRPTTTSTTTSDHVLSDHDMEIYSEDSRTFSLRYFIYDTQTDKIVVDNTGLNYNSNTYGRVNISSSTKYNAINNRYYAALTINYTPKNIRYVLGLTVTGTSGQRVDIYSYKNSTVELDDDDNTSLLTAGDATQSMNDNVTGNYTISVGNYNTRVRWTASNNSTYYFSNAVVGDIAPSSSYGWDRKASPAYHPFIAAPGRMIISSYTTAYTESADMLASRKIFSKTKNGKTYWWCASSGTSMAAPHVAGILACWLEADPTLRVDRVKQILSSTAIHDNYTEAKPERFGNGKVNAWQWLYEESQYAECTLAELLEMGDKTKSYVVTDLTAVGPLDDYHLVCTDNSGDAVTVPEGARDYMSQTPFGSVTSQSNWIVLEVPNPITSALLGKKLKNVVGQLTNSVNPEMIVTDMPQSDEESVLTVNTYVPSSFAGTQVSPINGQTYFFAQPRPSEWVHIEWAVWNGTKFITALNSVNPNHNQAGLSGDFDINGLYLDAPADLQADYIYSMDGVVRLASGVVAYPPLYVIGNQANSDNWDPSQGIELYTADGTVYQGYYQAKASNDGMAYMSFTRQLGTWSEINKVGVRIGADTQAYNYAANIEVSSDRYGQALPLRDDWTDGTRPFKLAVGEYHLTVDLNAMTLVVMPYGTSYQSPRRADGQNRYVVYPVTLLKGEDIITGVTTVAGSKQSVAVTYVNTVGQVANRPWQGVNVVITRYADGTTRTTKAVY